MFIGFSEHFITIEHFATNIAGAGQSLLPPAGTQTIPVQSLKF
jgi:hypothetical protein